MRADDKIDRPSGYEPQQDPTRCRGLTRHLMDDLASVLLLAGGVVLFIIVMAFLHENDRRS